MKLLKVKICVNVADFDFLSSTEAESCKFLLRCSARIYSLISCHSKKEHFRKGIPSLFFPDLTDIYFIWKIMGTEKSQSCPENELWLHTYEQWVLQTEFPKPTVSGLWILNTLFTEKLSIKPYQLIILSIGWISNMALPPFPLLEMQPVRLLQS